ncbi:hypothetical protein D3P07_10350 [Paenibacillus sp. 1011MAR3C5]|uniref:hypothetical protein n=1 Tax=Paenibacillus sp. 1011MAR3C5 TaxID=1675787 RepID=UPI000E6D4587|nr:hypothetical protein [Paenibacillus sp. 1011MAR3C5]RJE88398.1 hypothetical protein D3P07_10350 [Paenibacillus sp. 1011MAR3C5]
MYSNGKVAILATLAGTVFLTVAFFLGFLMVGIIFFPIIWGLTYKAIEKKMKSCAFQNKN